MNKYTSVIPCFMLLAVFSTFNRADDPDDLVVRCCDRVNICGETLEDADCGTNPDGSSIPYTCERVHQYPICPNNGLIKQTCNRGQPACEFPDEDDDDE